MPADEPYVAIADEQALEVLELIAEGCTVRTACQKVGVAKSTFLWWKDRDPSRVDQYARARDACIDHWADETIDIADDGSRDYRMGEHGPVVDFDHIARSKLRVDSRKWMASKLKPEKYGERVNVSGNLNVSVTKALEEARARAAIESE